VSRLRVPPAVRHRQAGVRAGACAAPPAAPTREIYIAVGLNERDALVGRKGPKRDKQRQKRFRTSGSRRRDETRGMTHGA
jgi:hypothetical protein